MRGSAVRWIVVAVAASSGLRPVAAEVYPSRDAPPAPLFAGPIPYAPEPEKPTDARPRPFAHVVTGLCEGDAAVRARFVAGVRAFAATIKDPDDFRGNAHLDWVKHECETPEVIAWFEREIAAHAVRHPLVAELFDGIKRSTIGKGDPLGQGLDWRVRTPGFDWAAWIGTSRVRRVRARSAASRCVQRMGRQSTGREETLCLHTLATVDWTAARSAANKLVVQVEQYLRDEAIFTTLRRFDTKQAARDHVVTLGLLPALPPGLTDGEFLAIDVLRRAGRHVGMPAQVTDEVDYGLVLARLATACRTWLGGAVFDDAHLGRRVDGVRSVELRGWMDGLRWSVEGREGAGLGFPLFLLTKELVNAMLEARRAPVRVGYLSASGLVIAPTDALARAAAEHLIDRYDP